MSVKALSPDGKPPQAFLISQSADGEFEIMAVWTYFPETMDLEETMHVSKTPVCLYLTSAVGALLHPPVNLVPNANPCAEIMMGPAEECTLPPPEEES